MVIFQKHPCASPAIFQKTPARRCLGSHHTRRTGLSSCPPLRIAAPRAERGSPPRAPDKDRRTLPRTPWPRSSPASRAPGRTRIPPPALPRSKIPPTTLPRSKIPPLAPPAWTRSPPASSSASSLGSASARSRAPSCKLQVVLWRKQWDSCVFGSHIWTSDDVLSALRLSKKVKLDWDTRLKIAVGAAQGLAYLHHDCNPRIIHRDVKYSNILRDENFVAHLSDFGIAKCVPSAKSHASTYEKSDVYSF